VAEKEPSQFQQFKSLTRKLLAVPKREADEERAKKPKRSGPNPKSA